jgi:hypothetical protein
LVPGDKLLELRLPIERLFDRVLELVPLLAYSV